MFVPKKKPALSKNLYSFTDDQSSFRVDGSVFYNQLYFPLVNEAGLMSAITPNLNGDIKLDQHTFLTEPLSVQDLMINPSARNFWIAFSGGTAKQKEVKAWSVTGNSSWQKSNEGQEKVRLEAGFLWHQITRTNSQLGLEAQVLNFVPAISETCEIMKVQIKNISKKPIRFTATSAIPLYGRSADNLRDHRHVTSLLHRLEKTDYGIHLKPTMLFNERGHAINSTSYYVLGTQEGGGAPVGVFPTFHSFIGEGGSLDKPLAIFQGQSPQKKIAPCDQGQEAMGALQFKSQTLKPGQSSSYILLLGIDRAGGQTDDLVRRAGRADLVETLLQETKSEWKAYLSKIEFRTGNDHFNHWLRWVQVQPRLRKLFGNSFLPDFDYGKGGRGWRDLWQDCLALLLSTPLEVRQMIKDNFGGVRLDGSNATIIGRKANKVEFIADRNNITRTWMDHGLWPFITTQLYLNQTGDWDLFFEKSSYFEQTKTGTILEHILIQHLVPFFNVGEHNIIRLLDADWNDGLDMAAQRGESVAFTHLFAGNLDSIADLLESGTKKAGWKNCALAKELSFLLDQLGEQVNYENIKDKTERLKKYIEATQSGLSGEQQTISISDLVRDLRAKASWIKNHLNKNEWVEEGGLRWFNGYYDNQGRRIEGTDSQGRVRMTLTGQVFPIMAGTADAAGVHEISEAVDRTLYDKKVGGIRLNTDFGDIQPDLGRAFSFAYGEKENGAIFSHMVVMYANALYQRGFVDKGHRAIHSLYELAKNSHRSRIFPGLPEYFNQEGCGRYHYLTGSASWYILTMLTQVFGVRGEGGDLLINPKLDPSQFDRQGKASVSFHFSGAHVKVEFVNLKKVPYEKMKISSVTTSQFTRISDQAILIPKNEFTGQKNINLVVTLDSSLATPT